MNYTIYIKEKNLATNIKAAVHEYIKRLSPFCKATVCCAGKKKKLPLQVAISIS